ncbi:unnamed protein product [Vitrella brassicaformis CCMP3155]|uniref:EF-hand domain-containing protein n=4 Tax=Vitrella brassicaformis TaxID=1169539 RepID=A0A0G4EAV8_VITBC|nr:unnamed protein product [Vitrella brassicaformis CCMP3155]|eukprot:CEL93043.1 unnamed protein product [Vitrella brassicaformis CCMP3155]
MAHEDDGLPLDEQHDEAHDDFLLDDLLNAPRASADAAQASAAESHPSTRAPHGGRSTQAPVPPVMQTPVYVLRPSDNSGGKRGVSSRAKSAGRKAASSKSHGGASLMPSARKGSEGALLSEKDRAERYFSVRDENNALKRHQAQLNEQIRALTVKLQRLQGDLVKSSAYPCEGLVSDEIEQLREELLEANERIRKQERLLAHDPSLKLLSHGGGYLRARAAMPLPSLPSPRRSESPIVHSLRCQLAHAKEQTERFQAQNEQLIDQLHKMAGSGIKQTATEDRMAVSAPSSSDYEVENLRKRLREADDERRSLMSKIQQLAENPFLSALEGNHMRLIRVCLQEARNVQDQLDILESERKRRAAEIDMERQQYRSAIEQNERLKVRLEDRDNQLASFHDRLRIFMGVLSSTEQEFVQQFLGELMEKDIREGKRLAPGGNMLQLVDQLRLEKAQLAEEVQAAHSLLKRETAIASSLRSLHDTDINELTDQISAMAVDSGKWRMLADQRQHAMRELQTELAKAGTSQDRLFERPDMQPSGENSLDIYIGQGQIESAVVGGDEGTSSCILVEFYDYDAAGTQEGLHMELCVLREPGERPMTLGRCQVPLGDILNATPAYPSPAVRGTATFVGDGRAVGRVDYRIRIRSPIIEHIDVHKGKRQLVDAQAATEARMMIPHGVQGIDSSLLAPTPVHTLLINVESISGLPPSARSYVYFELPEGKRHFTQTMQGGDPRFESECRVRINVSDAAALQWMSQQALHCFVFDDTAEDTSQAAVLGECHASLMPLLLKASHVLRESKCLSDPSTGKMTAAQLHVQMSMHTDAEGARQQPQPQQQPSCDHVALRIAAKMPAIETDFTRAWNMIGAKSNGLLSSRELSHLLLSLPFGLSRDGANLLISYCPALPTDRESFLTFVQKHGGQIDQGHRQLIERIAGAFERSHKTADQIFSEVDIDRSGRLSQHEFSRLLLAFDDSLTDSDLGLLWHNADKDGSGNIDRDEFAKLFFRHRGRAATDSTIVHLLDRLRKRAISEWLFGGIRETHVDRVDMSERLRELSCGLSNKELEQLLDHFAARNGLVDVESLRRELDKPPGGIDLLVHNLGSRIRRAIERTGASIEDIFARVDEDGSGRLERAEFRAFVERFEPSITPRQFQGLLDCLDKDWSGSISLRDFRAFIGDKTEERVVTETHSDGLMNRLCRCFDAHANTLLRLFLDHSGELARDEWVAELSVLPVAFSLPELDHLFWTMKGPESDRLTYDDFVAAIDQHRQLGGGKATQVLRRICEAIERAGVDLSTVFSRIDTRGLGYITPSQFASTLTSFEPSLTDTDIEYLVSLADKDHDGEIDFREFARLMRESSTDQQKPLFRLAPPLPPQQTQTGREGGAKTNHKGEEAHIASICGRIAKRFIADQRVDLSSLETMWGQGSMDHLSLRDFLPKLGAKLSADEADMLAAHLTKRGTRPVSFRQLESLLESSAVKATALDQWAIDFISRVKQAALRKGTSMEKSLNTDVISSSALKSVLKGVCVHMPETQLQRLWDVCPKESDGTVLPPVFFSYFSQSLPSYLSSVIPTGKGPFELRPPVPLRRQRIIKGDEGTRRGEPAESAVDREMAHVLLGKIRQRLEQRGLTAERAFRLMDADKSGSLSLDEFTRALSCLHLGLSSREIASVFSLIDTNNNRSISLAEFSQALSTSSPPAVTAAWLRRLTERIRGAISRAAVGVEDVWRRLADGKSSIGFAEFEKMVRAFEPSLGDGDLHRYWSLLDKDHSNALEYDEFADAFGPSTDGYPIDVSSVDWLVVLGRVYLAMEQRGDFALLEAKSPLAYADFLSILSRMQAHVSHAEAQVTFSHLDTDGDGRIDTNDIREGMDRADTCEETQKELNRLETLAMRRDGRRLLQWFSDRHPSSSITAQKFLASLLSLDPHLPSSTTTRLIHMADKTAKGRILFIPFITRFAGRAIQEPPTAPAVPSATSEEICVLMDRLVRRLEGYQLSVTQAFAMYDIDQDELLRKAEFAKALWSMNLRLALDEIELLFSHIDSAQTGQVSIGDLQRAVQGHRSQNYAQWGEDIFQRVVASLARTGLEPASALQKLDRHGNGLIDARDFTRFLKTFEPSLAEDDLIKLLCLVDKDTSGAVDADEFIKTFAAVRAPSVPVPRSPTFHDEGTFVPTLAADDPYSIILARIRGKMAGIERLVAHDDRIDAVVYGTVMKRCGIKLSAAELAGLFGRLDTDKDGYISLRDLRAALSAAPTREWADALFRRIGDAIVYTGRSLVDEMREADIDGRGAIGSGVFRGVLRGIEPRLTDQELENMTHYANKAEDGSIDIEDSLNAMARADPRTARRTLEGVAGCFAKRVRQLQDRNVLERAFARHDTAKSGIVTASQFARAITSLWPSASDSDLMQLLRFTMRGSTPTTWDQFAYEPFLRRFADDTGDFHPVAKEERGKVARHCQLLQDALVARELSLPDLVEGASLSRDVFVDRLRTHQVRVDPAALVSVLRLTAIDASGKMDTQELIPRFNLLLRERETTTAEKEKKRPLQLALPDRMCPVALTESQQHALKGILARRDKQQTGYVPFDTLVMALYDVGVDLPPWRQDQLRRWLVECGEGQEPHGHVCYLPLLTPAAQKTETISKTALTAGQALRFTASDIVLSGRARASYTAFRLECEFANHILSSPLIPAPKRNFTLFASSRLRADWSADFPLAGKDAVDTADLREVFIHCRQSIIFTVYGLPYTHENLSSSGAVTPTQQQALTPTAGERPATPPSARGGLSEMGFGWGIGEGKKLGSVALRGETFKRRGALRDVSKRELVLYWPEGSTQDTAALRVSLIVSSQNVRRLEKAIR